MGHGRSLAEVIHPRRGNDWSITNLENFRTLAVPP
jgi:hypothetical protein